MKIFFRLLATIIGIVGFITGIVLGNVLRIQEITSRLSEAKFNYTIMFSTWLSAFLLVAVFVGIYAILDNQDAIYNNINGLYSNAHKIQNIVESIEKTSTK